jgi:circadian clock protein KaiC
MMEGGVPSSSITMLLGASGTCKTMLGLHFLDAGAAAGERGLLFTFFEHPEEIVERAQRLGLVALPAAIERGDVRVIWENYVEANIDRIGNDLVRAFDEHKPARVFIDGMHGFQVTAEEPTRVHDFFAALTDYFTTQEATFVFTAETRDLAGQQELCAPFANASRICHNIVVTRLVELNSKLERVLTIAKMRDSGFDTSSRMMVVGEGGMRLADVVPRSLR